MIFFAGIGGLFNMFLISIGGLLNIFHTTTQLELLPLESQPIPVERKLEIGDTFSPQRMTSGKDCYKEVKGWPPHKVVADLRPYMNPPDLNSPLILPSTGAHHTVQTYY